MSQLFDYFVCSRAAAEGWADALEARDEDLQATLEAGMPQFVTLTNIGQDETNILAACIAGEADTVAAVGEVDLVRAVSAEDGPWLMAFRPPAVSAIAGAAVGPELLGRWAEAASRHHGADLSDCRARLTTDAALCLKGVCARATRDGVGLFVCFYG